jgi:tetratricopeptide (TPR) repeat protein
VELRRKLDTARAARAILALKRPILVAVLLSTLAMTGAAADVGNSDLQNLVEAQQWQEIISRVSALPTRSADQNYYLGAALAQMGRWEEARDAFLAGHRLQPNDKRFPQELSGVAFRLNNYPEATRELHRALVLDPEDAYTLDFLGSVYFLEGNINAALKYWNRVGKPKIEQIRTDPIPQVDAVLLDRAFTFSPASVMKRAELEASRSRIEGLGIFPQFSLELQARSDGRFDVIFRNRERNGWGQSKWEKAFLMLRGLPFQTVYFDFYNLGGEAVNFRSMYRWDAEKRRVTADFSGPWRRDPRWRYHLGTDLRSENWNVQTAFSGPTQLLGGLNLRREALSAGVTRWQGDLWRWSTGVELSHRDFRDVVPGVALSPELLAKGYQLKHLAEVNATVWEVPERRLRIEASGTSQIARLWSDSQESFAKLRGNLKLHWFPMAAGDDYELQESLHAGRGFGDMPFDELSVLGLMQGNDLWMRAHIATRGGRKGSAPLGRNYFLSNFEIDKNVYHKGPLQLKFGPFLDTGKINDPDPALGSHKWLWDAGVQAKPRLFGITASISYGRDLRSGRGAFYITLAR